MEKYLNLLIEQYKQATGVRNVDTNSSSFMSEFTEWLKSRGEISDSYLNLLQYMGLSRITYPDAVEVGKGKYDSIMAPFDTTIITPYPEGLNISPKYRLIVSDFKVCEGTPLLVRSNKQIDPIIVPSPLTFMTQNPYTGDSIRNWEQLHNSGNHDIVVGVYGSIYDKDAAAKVRQLEDFKNRLMDTYKEEHTVEGDTYCYAIASEDITKRLIKKRNR